jgi:hypothetical protein
MRVIAPIVALALAGLTAPATLACRIAPEQIPILISLAPPAPDEVRPGEVVLEVAFPANSELFEPSQPDDAVIVTSCGPIERSVLQIVRVLTGDARGAKFVIMRGGGVMAVPVPPIDPVTGLADSVHWFAVGKLNTQDRYAVRVDDPTISLAERTPASLNAR